MSAGRRAVDEQLVNAVYAGDLAAVRRALAAGASPDLVVQAGETILMLATSVPGDTQVPRMLLARGARLDAVDDSGRTPLHHAAMAGRTDVARLLLARGARADAKTPDGKTALDIALDIWRKADLVSLLRAHTREPRPDTAARTLAMAIDTGDERAAGRVIAASADPAALAAGLQAAVRRGDAALTQDLIAAGADVAGADSTGRTPLHIAAWYGRAECARRLLGAGAAVDVRDAAGATPLHAAAATLDAPPALALDVARALLGAGANPHNVDIHGYSVRASARARGRTEWLALVPAAAGEWGEDESAAGIAWVGLIDRDDVRLTYRPNDWPEPFQVETGPRRDPSGMTCAAGRLLRSDGPRIAAAGGGWIVLILERMARGERITCAEMDAAFRAQHGRAPDVHRFPR